MKKSLIALAVAGAMTAPMIAQADATLYGSFRMGVADTSNTGFEGDETDGDLDVIDTSSRMGIKGDVDLGLEGTKGLFHWEAQVYGTDDADQGQALGNRLMYIGAKGAWGQATIGKQYHPHYLLINAPTNVFHPGSGTHGERFNLGNQFHKRQQNTIAYASPKMNGFQVIAGVVILGDTDDNDKATDDTVDGYNVAATYSANNLTVSGSYGHVESDEFEIGTIAGLSLDKLDSATYTKGDTIAVSDYEKEVWGLSVKYTIDSLELMAKYEDLETTGNDGVDDGKVSEDVVELAARYTTANGTAVYGRYADYDIDAASNSLDVAGSASLKQWGLGVSQKMGKGIVYLEHVNNDSDDYNGDRTVAGYRLDF